MINNQKGSDAVAPRALRWSLLMDHCWTRFCILLLSQDVIAAMQKGCPQCSRLNPHPLRHVHYAMACMCITHSGIQIWVQHVVAAQGILLQWPHGVASFPCCLRCLVSRGQGHVDCHYGMSHCRFIPLGQGCGGSLNIWGDSTAGATVLNS